MSRRPVVLLPPAKGKAPGGTGPAYATTLLDSDPLTPARRRVLDAVVAAAHDLDDAALARIAGVRRSDVASARAQLIGLDAAPTMPTGVRTAGIVHRNARLAEATERERTLPVEVLLVSGLLGISGLTDPIPDHRLELAVTLPPLGGLATFWKRELADHLEARLSDRAVLDLLPGEHARAIPSQLRSRPGWTSVAFLRPDGRAANAARTKVAKGRLVAGLLAARQVAADGFEAASLAERRDLGEGWRLAADGDHRLVATYAG